VMGSFFFSFEGVVLLILEIVHRFPPEGDFSQFRRCFIFSVSGSPHPPPCFVWSRLFSGRSLIFFFRFIFCSSFFFFCAGKSRFARLFFR